MIGHHCETMQQKLALFSIAKKRLQKKVCVRLLLKVSMLKKRRDGDRVGLALLLRWLHG